MPGEDTKPASTNGPEQKTAKQQTPDDLSALADNERVMLDILMTSATAKTAAQLSTATGLPRSQVVTVLESLRVKGLVTRFNTVIESYGARFPGVELR